MQLQLQCDSKVAMWKSSSSDSKSLLLVLQNPANQVITAKISVNISLLLPQNIPSRWLALGFLVVNSTTRMEVAWW